MRTLLAPIVALGLCLPAVAGGDGWETGFAAAKAKAKKEGKDLLLNFTGSDWCIWCHRLHDEVFAKEHFEKEATKYFVLVELDFPREKKLPEETVEQNRKLQELFEIEGFPTIVLTDAEGRAYARTGYRPGGAEKYVEHLLELRGKRLERDRLLAQAEKAEGIERAKLLSAALEVVEAADALYGYDEVIAEIEKLDADGKLGLAKKWKARAAIKQGMKAVRQAMMRGDSEGALAEIAKLLELEGLEGARKQEVLVFKTMVLGRGGDHEAATEALRQAIEAAPKGERADQLRKVLERLEKMGEDRKKKAGGAGKGPAKGAGGR